MPRDEAFLRPATQRQWLARILQNLVTVFQAQDRADDADAMRELRGLLAP